MPIDMIISPEFIVAQDIYKRLFGSRYNLRILNGGGQTTFAWHRL